MEKEKFYLVYTLIGLVYWAVNVFIRKLPEKNDPGSGWILAPVWFLMWPICIIALILNSLINIRSNKL